jgi:integration host factor, beta subunit
MTKSELIERIVTHQGLLSSKDVELAIKTMLEQMSQCLATGDRIEIRGFGSFSLHYRAPRVGRNPKTGQSVELGRQVRAAFQAG